MKPVRKPARFLLKAVCLLLSISCVHAEETIVSELDYQAFDANHTPIAMPANRVVPPELAPPGLPIRRIVVPAPTQAP